VTVKLLLFLEEYYLKEFFHVKFICSVVRLSMLIHFQIDGNDGVGMIVLFQRLRNLAVRMIISFEYTFVHAITVIIQFSSLSSWLLNLTKSYISTIMRDILLINK